MKLLKYILLTALFAILIITAAYRQRGYWAVGAEVLLPVILLIILLKTGDKKC